MEDQNVALKNEIEICNNKLESVGKKLKYFEELIVDKQNELKGKENVNPSNKNGLDLKLKNCTRCGFETFSEGKLRHHKAVKN